MLMDSRQAPPAPPPLQPITPAHNPYDFITQPSAPKKGRLFGGSKKQRILIIGVGVMLLFIVVSLIIGLLGSADTGLKADYLTAAQQQTELIRISDIGVKQARSAEAKNLAFNAKSSLVSEQPALLKLAKKARASTDAKSLSGSKDSQTDALLTNAAQTNQFDAIFIKTMQTNLKNYQATLKKIYDQSTQQTTKDILSKDYANAGVLIGEEK